MIQSTKFFGNLLSCGQNNFGQLGLGEDIPENLRPSLVPNVSNVVDVKAGGMHSLYLTNDGKIYSFGCNDEGALGRDTSVEGSEHSSSPVDLPAPCVKISAGYSHSGCLLDDGRAFAWGSFRDSNGYIGLTLDGSKRFPIEIVPILKFVDIASGADHLVLLSNDGRVYTVGCAEQGQLGRVSARSSSGEGRRGRTQLLVPEHINLKRLKADAVWASAYCTFIRVKNQSDNNIMAFGLNNYGQLGLPKTDTPLFVPRPTTFTNVKSIVGGRDHTLVLTNDNKCLTIGRKEYGRLGIGEVENDAETLVLIEKLNDEKVIQVACGESCSFAVTENGKVFAWGYGSDNQLGTGSDENAFVPTLLTDVRVKNKKVIAVASGVQHTLVVVAQDMSSIESSVLTTGTYLQHLNEDCLLEIFSKKSLTPMDLCSLAETCTSFEQIAQRVFPKDYGIAATSIGEYQFTSKNYRRQYTEQEDVVRILKNFGPHLSTLSISLRDQPLLNALAEGDVALTELEIDKHSSSDRLQLNLIYQRLLKLTIKNCDFLNDFVSLDFCCDSLIELHIGYSKHCNEVLKHSYRRLKRFTWHNSRYVQNNTDDEMIRILSKFIRRHGHLEAIELHDDSICCGEFLSVININCTELEELGLGPLMYSIEINSQGSLEKLKILDLYFCYITNYNHYIAPLQAMKSLQTLKLSYMNVPSVQMFDSISQLQALRELHLTNCYLDRIPWTMLNRLPKLYVRGFPRYFRNFDLSNIITNLKKLNFLLLDHGYVDTLSRPRLSSEEEFSKLIKVAASRKHVLTLQWNFHCNFEIKKFCDENQKVKIIKM